MKANLDKDRIINFHRDGDVEVNIPRGVGLERIRVVAGQVIDLADLTEIWVENVQGAWILHAASYPGCQLVTMTLADKKNLMNDSGTYRVKTQQEIDDEEQEEINEQTDNQELKQNLKTLVENLKFGKIDQHIENTFGQLNSSQKASLKTLYKSVLYLAKNR